ncbi:acyltransferase [Bradyrhizobium sp. C9]|uniref:acyltransferase family protein n=1 Tax=Bradyrhizobium sp. C9 TaxID=142585 RepID=UPI0013044C10|nr:acyltransferase [Bradyrhizobium sp. C9]
MRNLYSITANQAANKEQQKNLDIELFRGFAVAITVVSHFGYLIHEWFEWTGYFWLGGGVDLFFAISGFLITRSLLDSLERNRSFVAYAKLFWIRRLFRLWPAALTWSTLFLLLSIFVDFTGFERDEVFRSWLFGALNIENLYIYACSKSSPPCSITPLWHYWSLSLEEQFYLLLPFALFFTRQRKLLIWPCLAIAFCQAVSLRPWGHLLWFIRSDSLMYGTVVGIGWRYYGPTLESGFSAFPRWLLQLFLAGLSVLLIVVARDQISQRHMGLVAVTAGLIVLILSRNSNLFTEARMSKIVATYIGSRSYSLYLVHVPILWVLREMLLKFSTLQIATNLQHQIFALALGLAFSLILSECSYRFIESPCRRLGRRIASRA